MARIRTIKPECPQSESLGRVSRDARLLFIMLWTICDDEGRTRAASRMLASLLFPYDDDAPVRIPEWLMELEREKCVRVYAIDGNTYLEVTNWSLHQKIDKPTKSKLPAPPILAKVRERSRKSREASPVSIEGSSEDRDLDLDQGPRTKEGTKESCAEPPTAPAPEAPQPFISLPTNRPDEEFPVSEAEVLEFGSAYGAVDVRQELRAMRAWLIANERQRKTTTGMLRFVNSWLAKEQNRGGRIRGSPEPNGIGVPSERLKQIQEAQRKRHESQDVQ